jgi:hypothetical protein
MTFWDSLKALRDGVLAARAAKLPDDITPVVVAKGNNNIIPLPKRPGLLARIQHAGDYADDVPKPASLPLVYTAGMHTATSISGEFANDPRFDAEVATRQWLADQRKTTWRDSNSQLPRKAT